MTGTAAHVAAIASPYAPILRAGEHLGPAKPVTRPGGSQVPGFMA
ncbi:hypothetical protein AB0J63_04340 [Streptosporangium canum]